VFSHINISTRLLHIPSPPCPFVHHEFRAIITHVYIGSQILLSLSCLLPNSASCISCCTDWKILAWGSTSGISTSGTPGKPGPFRKSESFGPVIVVEPTCVVTRGSLPGGEISKSVVCEMTGTGLMSSWEDKMAWRVGASLNDCHYLIDVGPSGSRIESRYQGRKLPLQNKLVVPSSSLATRWCRLFFHKCSQEIAIHHHLLELPFVAALLLVLLVVIDLLANRELVIIKSLFFQQTH
jgi:hypothetical protein